MNSEGESRKEVLVCTVLGWFCFKGSLGGLSHVRVTVLMAANVFKSRNDPDETDNKPQP